MKKFKLKGIDQCEYTKNGVVNVAGMNDKQEFSVTKVFINDRLYLALQNTLSALGINEQEACFATLASILHLGNIDVSISNDGNLQIEDKFPLMTASELLGINADVLEKAILSQPSQKQAKDFIDSLANEIYTRLFSWLVHSINQNLTAKETISNFIILLDIPGFNQTLEVF